MEHFFLLRRQTHELKMRQLVEGINLGRHTIESAMVKYEARTRQTVTKWLERVRQEELAEFERELIRERTYAGLAATRARGRVGGRACRIKPSARPLLPRRSTGSSSWA